MKARIVNGLTVGIALVVFLIASGAFVLSYEALHKVALDNGQPADRAWIWPLLIDLPLVTFTLALLTFEIMRQDIRWWWFLVILFTGLTVFFNLSHAPDTWLGRAVAVIPPVGLFLSTEALRHIARDIIERGTAIASLSELDTRRQQAAAELDKLTGQLDTAKGQLEAIRQDIRDAKTVTKATNVQQMNAARQEKIDQRRQNVLSLLQQGQDENAIAEALGVSVRTVKRDKEHLNGQVNYERLNA